MPLIRRHAQALQPKWGGADCASRGSEQTRIEYLHRCPVKGQTAKAAVSPAERFSAIGLLRRCEPTCRPDDDQKLLYNIGLET
jgi:hypothetical protein